MSYILYVHLIVLAVVLLLTIPYIRWSTLLKEMQSVNPTHAFVSRVKFQGNKTVYNLVFSYDGIHRSVWVSKGVGKPTLTSTIPIVLIPAGRFSKNDVVPYTMEYITGRVLLYINIIMSLMAIGTTTIVAYNII